MSSNVIEFPGHASRITVQEVLDNLIAAVAAGQVENLLIVTMAPDTVTKVGMSSAPAHCLTYMNTLARMEIEELMRGNVE